MERLGTRLQETAGNLARSPTGPILERLGVLQPCHLMTNFNQIEMGWRELFDFSD
jgi:hypothetical protein